MYHSDPDPEFEKARILVLILIGFFIVREYKKKKREKKTLSTVNDLNTSSYFHNYFPFLYLPLHYLHDQKKDLVT